jgi:exodeoxyribonuclease VII small subunit
MKEPLKAKSGEFSESISYKDAVTELEAILEEIETGDTDIDTLSEKVKRALFLIQLCRNRLRATDEELKKLMSGFDNPDTA